MSVPRLVRRSAAVLGVAAAVTASLALSSPSSAQVVGPDLIGLRAGTSLVRFDPATPGTSTVTSITGLGTDTLIGIDTRPANGALVGFAADGTIYTINATTGAATAGANASIPLTGADSGVDFNPVPDRLRVEGGSSDQNLRMNVETGAVATDVSPTGDTALNYAAPDAGADPLVVGAAYTNSITPSPRDAATQGATQLFVIDSNLDILALQNPPNAGTLTRVGALGVNSGNAVGFEIYSTAIGTNIAYAALSVNGASGLYTIDLTTGAATLVGSIANAQNGIVGLTAVAKPGAPAATTTTTTTATTLQTTTSTTNRVLARTGNSDNTTIALLGGALLVAGFGVVLAARARRVSA